MKIGRLVPTLHGIAEDHGLALFRRRYTRCDCDGWDEFWDEVDEGKNPTGLTLTGRSHHRRQCPKHHLSEPESGIGDEVAQVHQELCNIAFGPDINTMLSSPLSRVAKVQQRRQRSR